MGLSVFWRLKQVGKHAPFKHPDPPSDKDKPVVYRSHLADLRKISPLGLHKENTFWFKE